MTRRFSRKKSTKSGKFVLCPYCGAKYTNSNQIISVGPKSFFTSVTRRIYGCYNCKNILGLGSKQIRQAV